MSFTKNQQIIAGLSLEFKLFILHKYSRRNTCYLQERISCQNTQREHTCKGESKKEQQQKHIIANPEFNIGTRE